MRSAASHDGTIVVNDKWFNDCCLHEPDLVYIMTWEWDDIG